jgi:phosphopantetheine--protein transferase-like protein
MTMGKHDPTDLTLGDATASVDISGRSLVGASPLVSRVLEAEQQTGDFESAGFGASRIGAPDDLEQENSPDESPILPFLGPVKLYEPGKAIRFDRRLCLQRDLYLEDHSFVHAPGVKPASSCLPVLPMTMSLEAMAEAAACLAPGEGLLGFENVTATRWIELEDTDATNLSFAADFVGRDPSTGMARIKTSIYVPAQKAPAIEATVLFGSDYCVGLDFEFSEFENPRSFPQSGEALYAERHMFHGPSFQCLHGEMIVADNGAIGDFVILSSENLFDFTRSPQLLACPTLLDAVGQFIGVWALAHERFAFPIGLGRLEIYCPTPPVGTLTPVRLEITNDQGKMLQANVEIQDGRGGVWMRIADWRSWKFKWPRRIVDFRRLPHRYLLSRDAPIGPSAPQSVFLMVSDEDLRGFDLMLLARYYLDEVEFQRYKALKRFPERQRQWLLGRVVAKDAVRKWVRSDLSQDFLHPAAVPLNSDDGDGPPRVTLGAAGVAPKISIAHCNDRAAAIAQSEPVGVDIEQIKTRDAAVLEAFICDRERDLLAAFSPEEFDVLCTKLWCAKEAVAKLLGVGIGSLMKSLEAVQIMENGEIIIMDRARARVYPVQTFRDEDYILAYVTQVAASEQDAMT